ncbi:MAG: hypothetical protein ABL309_13830 [Phycisphaerales bacterium]
MPLYSFVNQTTGETEERFYSMTEAPKIGEVIIGENGHLLERVVDVPRTNIRRSIECLHSESLPLNDPDAPRTDKQGRAVFTSRREIDEFVARKQGKGEKVSYIPT